MHVVGSLRVRTRFGVRILMAHGARKKSSLAQRDGELLLAPRGAAERAPRRAVEPCCADAPGGPGCGGTEALRYEQVLLWKTRRCATL